MALYAGQSSFISGLSPEHVHLPEQGSDRKRVVEGMSVYIGGGRIN